MQKSKFLALLSILAVFMTLVACPPADNGKEENNSNQVQTIEQLKPYVGKWYTAYPYPPYDDGFSISAENVLVYYNNGDPTNDIGYKGTVESVDVSGDYLFLNLKIVDPSRSPWGLAISSYTRVLLKSISSTQCQMTTACLPTSYDQTADTIANLKTKFTIETKAFDILGTYNKQ